MITIHFWVHLNIPVLNYLHYFNILIIIYQFIISIDFLVLLELCQPRIFHFFIVKNYFLSKNHQQFNSHLNLTSKFLASQINPALKIILLLFGFLVKLHQKYFFIVFRKPNHIYFLPKYLKLLVIVIAAILIIILLTLG